MLKRAHYNRPFLPYLLIFPQVLITVIFFFYPAFQAIYQSVLFSDPFGLSSKFVGLDNFKDLFSDSVYYYSIGRTMIFSILTTVLSMSSGLLLAVLIHRMRFMTKVLQTLFLLPYAIAPVVAGSLWLFMLHPSYGAINRLVEPMAEYLSFEWNPVLNGNHAMGTVVVAASWKQVSYNFIFFLSGLQMIPASILEAARLDTTSRIRKFFIINLPLLSPIIFFLGVINLIYTFFDTFGIIKAITAGGPGQATNILVYKVYTDGFVGLDLGSSSAQSVVLIFITVVITIIQFRYIEKKVHYV